MVHVILVVPDILLGESEPEISICLMGNTSVMVHVSGSYVRKNRSVALRQKEKSCNIYISSVQNPCGIALLCLLI